MNEYLKKLQSSPFRSKFKLKDSDKKYIEKVGIEKIKSHAYDFITKKLAPAYPKNDGKQTAFKGHPVFIAQHATATCCRGCLNKWWKIPQGREMTNDEIDFVVNLIMEWINQQLN